MDREFRLSPPGSGRGISCDANGAFIGTVPLLKRSRSDSDKHWEPRDCAQLSELISDEFGLPVDLLTKLGGLNAISRALNDGDLARAQIATVLLGVPDPPPLTEGIPSSGELIKIICDLSWSGMLKGHWDPTAHPRWPAGAPESQGGQFALKTEEQDTQDSEENNECGRTATIRRMWTKHYGREWPKDPKTGRNQDVAHIRARADGGTDEPTNVRPLPHDEHVKEHTENGDFSRWGKRPGIARAFGGTATPGPNPKANPPPQNASPKTAPPVEEQITPDEIPLDELPIFAPE